MDMLYVDGWINSNGARGIVMWLLISHSNEVAQNINLLLFVEN